MQGNLATVLDGLGRPESLDMRRDIHSGWLKLNGEEDQNTLREAICYSTGLIRASRFEEARSLLRKTLPVARRALGDMHDHMIYMRRNYAMALYQDPGATLADLREAVNTLEAAERTARRVLGSAHPVTKGIDDVLQKSRALLGARETPRGS